ncbi:MAG TPA: succinate dehydrogenase cytochrome b subunit [Candidatus Acidoferrum sp.]|nr:succinate dehydrogenase cytochrome b subunit [Candidatus Acidoferrum sp.]
MAESAAEDAKRIGEAKASRAVPSVFSANPLWTFWNTVIGKKIVMAVTGGVLILFVIAHVLGNLKIFIGPDAINAYARFLREVGQPELEYGQLLWGVRIVLLLCVILHVTAAVQLTRMSWQARPEGYREKKNLESTIASRTMRWGGLLLLVFIVFHILHFTLGVVGFAPGQYIPLDVYHNVLAAFALWPVSLFYIVSMAALCLHLDHGIWSAIQTLGWSTSRNERSLKIFSRVFAIAIFLGFISVPVAVMAGWVR